MVDLAPNDKQGWVGSLSFAENGPKEIPLASIQVAGQSVKFVIGGMSGAPSFDGKLNTSDRTLTGTANLGAGPVNFELKRTGEAKVAVPAPSAPLSKDLQGAWEGTVNAGQPLRLVLKLKNNEAGEGTGTLASLDQGGQEIQITGIVQKENSLEFQLKMIAAKYNGTINAARNEITGNWSQGEQHMPLSLRKRSASAAK